MTGTPPTTGASATDETTIHAAAGLTTDGGSTDPGSTDPGSTDPGSTDPGATDRPGEGGNGAGRRATNDRDEAASAAARFGRVGEPMRRGSPFYIGFFGGLGVLLAIAVAQALASARSVLILIVVSMFLAVGLSPVVERLIARGMRRGLAVMTVTGGVMVIFVGMVAALVPLIAQQISEFIDNAPSLLAQLTESETIRKLDEDYQIISKLQTSIASPDLARNLFGGVLGVGRFVLGALFSALTVLILTLYFLSSMPAIKRTMYALAPNSRRERVQLLGDEILFRVGGYVSGQLLVAWIAGMVTFVFLTVIRLDYAVALAVIIAFFSIIPLVGATIGSILVTALAFTDSATKAIVVFAFFVAYQQVENYVIYPRVMRRAVDVPPAVTIVAALLGGALLGIVGALLAIPTAAAVLLLLREVVLPRQESL
ncbi:MAG: AI-2E family transporter [Sporichthyaceae bacterium]|nr:AI-2E family transporter [Sporichthyaceae bacterium]